MKSFFAFLTSSLGLLFVMTAGQTPASAGELSEILHFSLLPKALQKNPRLELTAICEMTDDGRKLPIVTKDRPTYYVLSSNGNRQAGENYAHEKVMPQAGVARLLEKALAANGFLPAAPGKLPTVVIYYTWGSHNTLEENDYENPVHTDTEIARNLLDRAYLVGGAKLVRELRQVIQETEDISLMTTPALATGGEQPMQPAAYALINPLNRFRMHGAKNEFMISQCGNNVYYVVASAYDLASIASKKRVLLWRTQMTVGSNGLSQSQSFPALVASAAPFFGRDMTDPEIIVRHVVDDGQVTVGHAVVVPDATGATPTKK
jgi:hypothetical protein